MRVGGFLDPCRKNLGQCQGLLQSVSVRTSVRVGACFGRCR